MVNHWIGIGRIGRDVEMRYGQDGAAIASFSLACSEKFKTKSGEQREETFWAKCVAFGRLAEIIGEYCEKGSLIYVEAKFQERKWQDKDGNDRYTTEAVVRNMKMLSPKGDRSNQGDTGGGHGGGDPFPADDKTPF